MGETEDEMPGWHHQLNEHELEQIPGDSEGQESLVCCNPRGHQELDKTQRLKNNNNFVLNLSRLFFVIKKC